MLNERNQSQKATCCRIHFMWNVQNIGIQRNRKWISGCQGLREGGFRSGVTANGHWISFWSDRVVLKLPSDDDYTFCEILKATELYTFSSVQSLSRVRLFAAPWIATRQASLSITNFQSLLKLMSMESVIPSSHLILCHPLLLLPSVFPNIRVFSNKSTHFNIKP